MSSSLEAKVRLALRRALRLSPDPQIRAITLETIESADALTYHLVAFHHGPASEGLLDKLKAIHTPVFAGMPPNAISAARLTLKRRDRPKPVLSSGLPIFVQAGTVILPSPSPPVESLSPVAAPGPSLDSLDKLSAASLAKHPLSREAAKARGKALNHLKPEALLSLMHDGRGLKHVLPHALKAARMDPWADRGLRRGDLMMAVLHAPAGIRPVGTVLHKGIVALANAALKAAAKLPKGRRDAELEAEIVRLLKRWQASAG